MSNLRVSECIGIRDGFAPKAGDVVETHDHNFAHVTYVPRGGFRFEELDGRDGNVIRSIEKWAKNGRNWVTIKKGVWHRLVALEDNSIYHCIYSHRTPDGEVTEDYDGWAEAYL